MVLARQFSLLLPSGVIMSHRQTLSSSLCSLAGCRQLGASVGCSVGDCDTAYHVVHALKAGAQFLYAEAVEFVSPEKYVQAALQL